MKLSIGIVGLPNVGKSTLFHILTDQKVVIANYPFATIDPNVGVVAVPDTRVDALAEMSKSKKKVPAIVEFYDIAGLVKGASKGEGLGNQFLSHIRECSAICMVLRCFGKSDIIHIEGNVDALRDMEIVETELVLKDMETVEKRLAGLSRDVRAGNKEAKAEEEVLGKAHSILNSGKPLLSVLEAEPPKLITKGLNLLTAKPQIFLLNGAEDDVPEDLRRRIRERGSDYVIVDLDNVLEAPELITKAYEILGLQSFFTTGEDETRAWTIEKGTKAPQAAGVIHTDFEEKFIRAEVVSYDDLILCGDWARTREKGKLRLEGKEYEMRDGDVIVVRHG